jgi:glycerophosphoryl diester phosphodiesterase
MDYVAAAADGDEAARGLSPEARDALSGLRHLEPAGAAFVSYRWQDLPTERTRALREAGVPVLCWTTRSAEDDAAARAHADNVTFEGYRPPL